MTDTTILQPARWARRTLALAAAAAMTVTMTACDDDDDPFVPDEPSIAELASTTPQLTTLVTALDAADLVTTLDEGGPFTVFAPVNAAFDALGAERVARLLEDGNQELLAKVLTYHVVPGEIRAGDLTDGLAATTVEGSSLTFDLDGEATVNGVRIIATDIEAGNGVIHLVEGVLTQNLDVVDVAVVEGFESLVGAVEAAGLTETLRTDNGGDGFTIFAPTDAAFAAVGEVPGDPGALSQILLYHAVGGTVLSTQLSDGLEVTTLQGQTFTVDLDGGVTILGQENNAEVIATDVRAANGVIHVIDSVLLP